MEQETLTVNITESSTYSYTLTNVLSVTETDNTDNSSNGGSNLGQNTSNGQGTLPNTGSIFNTTTLTIIGLILIVIGIVSIKRNKIRD